MMTTSPLTKAGPAGDLTPQGASDDSRPRHQPSIGRYLFLAIVLAALWTGLYFSLAPVAHWSTYRLLGLPKGAHLASAGEFFIFEAPKVLLLLTVVVLVVGIIRSFFTPQRTRAILVGKREFVGNVLAACLGIVPPFCSCSAVPHSSLNNPPLARFAARRGATAPASPTPPSPVHAEMPCLSAASGCT